jgi:hypothetical protein
MGLFLHPYLIVVGLAAPFLLLTRMHLFPMKILIALLAFVGMYFVSVSNGTSIAVGEVFKLGSAMLTIIVCALLVRKQGDFVAGAIGLSLAVAVLAYGGLLDENSAGVEAVEGANKNSYSLFALPAILMAGYIWLWMPKTQFIARLIPVLCTLPALVAIFLSGNRSGYLGAVLVGGMLFWNKRGKGMLFVAGIAAVVMYAVVNFGSTEVFDERMRQTIEGNKSDDHRMAILYACLEIGLSNPLVGVSPQQLPWEIGRRTSVLHHYNYVFAHNVYAHLFAGSGVICLMMLFIVGAMMWRWKPSDGYVGGDDDPARLARRFLRMLVILWFVRAAFTHEIMYNPSFNIAFGLAIGLCMVADGAHKSAPMKAPPKN